MSNIEYEHSFKVDSIQPIIEYCRKNKYKEVFVIKQNRIVYENSFNSKIIARLTTEVNNGVETTTFDCKNVQDKKSDLNISMESIPMIVTDENREQILSILSTLSFKEVANNLRVRYVFEKGNIKFEIDEYIRPEMKVVAIEGEKEEVEKVYAEVKNLLASNWLGKQEHLNLEKSSAKYIKVCYNTRKRGLQMIKYVFFDLDETLIDIKKAQNEAIKSLYIKYQFTDRTTLEEFTKKWDDLTDYHYKFYTAKQISYEEQRRRRVVDLFKGYNVDLDRDPIEIYDIYLREFENAWTVYDDVVDTLKELKKEGYVLGLISNGDFDQQVQKVQKVGIYDMFDFINTSSQFAYSKPDARVYESIFKMHGVGYDEVVYVGNSYKKDILPCRQLGIKNILIDRKNVDYNDAELIKVYSLDEILSIIEDFNDSSILV